MTLIQNCVKFNISTYLYLKLGNFGKTAYMKSYLCKKLCFSLINVTSICWGTTEQCLTCLKN